MASDLSPLIKILGRLREAGDDMPLSMLVTFLHIGQNPGISIQELAKRTQLPPSTVSRAVSALDRYGRANRPGLELVQSADDPGDRRRKTVTLTPKGQLLVAELQQILS